MLAILSTPTFDPLGHIQLDVLPASMFDDKRRRVNRIATLDGGAVFNDFGFSHADRTIDLRWVPTDRDTEAAVARVTEFYSTLTLSFDGSAYTVAPELFTPGADQSTLRLLVVAQLA